MEMERTIMEGTIVEGAITDGTIIEGTIIEDEIDDESTELESDELEDDRKHGHVDPLIIGSLSSSFCIANATTKPIRVLVAENESHLKELNFQGHASVTVKGFVDVGGETKLAWEQKLHEAGFCTINPKNSLDFKVNRLNQKIFVTLYEENNDTPKHHNYPTSKKKSLLYTTNCGLVTSDRSDAFKPILTQTHAAQLANADPKLAGTINYAFGLNPVTGEIICWDKDKK